MVANWKFQSRIRSRNEQDDGGRRSAVAVPAARENFSIIAATVIKPNKREITASTRDHRHAAPLSEKFGKFAATAAAAAALMAPGKETDGASARSSGSKVVHHQCSS